MRIGIDLGGTKMQVTLFDGQLKEVAKRRRRTKGENGAKAGLERIESSIDRPKDVIAKMLQAAGGDPDALADPAGDSGATGP